MVNKNSHHRKNEVGARAYFMAAALGRRLKGITREAVGLLRMY